MSNEPNQENRGKWAVIILVIFIAIVFAIQYYNQPAPTP
jgi:hypothetical protein